MATWEDGPEYAPIERPTEFDAPEAAPLEVGPPRSLLTGPNAPDSRPDLQPPNQPVAPLDTLVLDRPEDERRPEEPFHVVQAIMTDATSAWSAAHSTVISSPVQREWAPPSGTPVAADTSSAAPGASVGDGGLGTGQRSVLHPAPNQPIRLSGHQPPPGAAPQAGPGPQPGTAHGFGHGQVAPSQPEPLTLGAFLASLTPFVLIALLIGGLIPMLSPMVFIVAFALSSRIVVATSGVRRTFIGGAVALGLVAIVVIFTGPDIGEWWSAVGLTSVIVCWAVLLTSAVLVLRALQSGVPAPVPGQPTPRHGNSWG